MTREQMLLTSLFEECVEVGQRCSKAIRFGMEERQKFQKLTNKERIIGELNDLAAVFEMVMGEPISNFLTPEVMEAKKQKVEQYLNYSRQLNIYDTDC